MYDGQSGSLIAARDPIGIRPLFYGRAKAGGIAFASEAIELEGWVEEIRPFPPGHYYKDGQFVPYTDVTKVDRVIDDPPEEISRNIREKLTAAVIKRLDADAPMGFLLSGWAGFQPGLRHCGQTPRQAHPHLCHRHGGRRH